MAAKAADDLNEDPAPPAVAAPPPPAAPQEPAKRKPSVELSSALRRLIEQDGIVIKPVEVRFSSYMTDIRTVDLVAPAI